MFTRIGLCLAFLVSNLGVARAVDPDDLLLLFPKEVNAVALINVQTLLSNARATKEGWNKLDHMEYLAGAIPVGPNIERIMLAKELTPGNPNKNFATMLVPLKKTIDFPKLAKAYNGQEINIAGNPAVQVGNNIYATELKPNILGVTQVTNKQEISRWIRYAKDAKASQLPGFCNGAVRQHSKTHHIMLALDTDEMFDAQNVGVAVATSKVLEGEANAKDAKEIQSFFSKLHGIRVMIMIRETGITADVYMESKYYPKFAKAELAKSFIIEFLGNYGAALEDLYAATYDLSDKTFHLGFKLSDPELANVMALFMTPLRNVSESDTLYITPQGISAEASARYYRTVNKIIDDLRTQTKKVKDYKKTALWHDTAAMKIETVSILGVDKQVADYAHGSAARMRVIADSMRGVPIQADALASKAYYYTYNTTSVGFTGRGFFPLVSQNVNSNYAEIQAATDKLVEEDEEKRKEMWTMLDQMRAKIRKEMAEKYKMDFDVPPKK